MTISIRLDPETETMLRDHLRHEGGSLSAFVRDAIQTKLAQAEAPATPYAVGEPLFGRYASGRKDGSQRRKQILREKLSEKHRR